MKRAEREGEAEEKRGLSGYNRPIPKVVTSRSSMPRLFCAEGRTGSAVPNSMPPDLSASKITSTR